MRTTHKIILCSVCEGKGVEQWDECVNYHKRDYITHSKNCKQCQGSGLCMEITAINLEPFKPYTPTKTL
jgi:hypothetical protein